MVLNYILQRLLSTPPAPAFPHDQSKLAKLKRKLILQIVILANPKYDQPKF